VYSFRDGHGQWDPKSQRPELWNLYNGRVRKGESIRAFPLSNWTELDVWQYIYLEGIPIVPLYFAAAAPGGGARGLAHHGRRRPDAAAARREAEDAQRAFPHAGLLPAERGGAAHGDDAAGDHPRRCCWREAPSGRAASSIMMKTARWN
jgi:3'-phosphoadenosine 5'-phosphosulfate sulfotransferase (PAPS reductase)/FAD synthetase